MLRRVPVWVWWALACVLMLAWVWRVSWPRPAGPAYWWWLAANGAAVVLFLWRAAPECSELPGLALVSVPLVAALAGGGAGGLWLIVFWAALHAGFSRREVTGGLLLSLCALHFQPFLLVPAALLAAGKRLMLLATAAGVSALYLLSMMLPEKGIAGWLAYGSSPGFALAAPNLPALASALGWSKGTLWLLAFVALALYLWLIVRVRQPAEQRFAWALAGSLLLGPSTTAGDAVLLFAALVAIPPAEPLRWGLIVLLAPPLYLLNVAGAISIPLFLLPLAALLAPLVRRGRV
jgi:hypothetical protein